MRALVLILLMQARGHRCSRALVQILLTMQGPLLLRRIVKRLLLLRRIVLRRITECLAFCAPRRHVAMAGREAP